MAPRSALVRRVPGRECRLLGVIVLFVKNLAVCFDLSFKNNEIRIFYFTEAHPFDAKSGAFIRRRLIRRA
jgi:hypothetical protein